MAVDYALLERLHHLLKMQTEYGSRIRKGPMKIKFVEDNEVSFLTAKDAAKELVTKTRMAIDAKQMQLNEREAKIEDLKGKLNACDSNKEFQLLKDRIAADLAANSVLQDEILEQLEKLDVVMEDQKAADENYTKAQAETKKTTEAIKLEISKLQLELEDVVKELGEAEKKLPGDILVEYKRLVSGKGEDALGDTDTNTCSNCNQTLTTQTVAELMLKKAIFCKGCGSLLYIKASHPAAQA